MYYSTFHTRRQEASPAIRGKTLPLPAELFEPMPDRVQWGSLSLVIHQIGMDGHLVDAGAADGLAFGLIAGLILKRPFARRRGLEEETCRYGCGGLGVWCKEAAFEDEALCRIAKDSEFEPYDVSAGDDAHHAHH